MLQHLTLNRLQAAWHHLDFVVDGVLEREDFESACGVDPIWDDLLRTYDIDGSRSITAEEFITGFTHLALQKPFDMEAKRQTMGRKGTTSPQEYTHGLAVHVCRV